MLFFCIGGLSFGKVPDDDGEAGNNFDSRIGYVIHYALIGAVLYYTVWFLYTGMDTMAAPPCSRYAFLFAKVVCAFLLAHVT